MEQSNRYKNLFAALAARSFTEVAKAAYQILEMPVVVTDTAFMVVAKCPDIALGDEQWDANVINQQIEPKFINTFNEDEHFAAHAKANHPILINWGHYENNPRLTGLIKSGDIVLGFISALATGKELLPIHYEDIEVVANAYSLLFSLKPYSHNMMLTGLSTDVRAGYLYALLDGTPVDEREMHAMEASLRETLEPPYVLASISPKSDYRNMIEPYFRWELDKLIGHDIQVIYRNRLYVLLGNVQVGVRDSSRMRLMADFLKRDELCAGFSRPFTRVYPFKPLSWQADKALSTGIALFPEETMFHYDEIMYEILLSELSKGIPRENLEHPSIIRLKQSDAEDGTQYMRTLQVYVENGFDKRAASEVLHIHRNTLVYRLEKIEELMGISPTDKTLSFFLDLEKSIERIGGGEPVSYAAFAKEVNG